MNLLLIGNDSRLMDVMINKLGKSNHRIYRITGHKGKKTLHKHVLETYTWSFDQLVGASVGKQVFTRIPPLCCFINQINIRGWQLIA